MGVVLLILYYEEQHYVVVVPPIQLRCFRTHPLMSRGHINLPLFVRSFVRPDINTWFVRLSPPTVLELQL